MNIIIHDNEMFDALYLIDGINKAWQLFVDYMQKVNININNIDFCGITKTKNQIIIRDAGRNNKYTNYIIRREK